MNHDRLIFVCDDQQEDRETVGAFLTKLGYRVLQIATGAELLVAVFLERPDAILLDLFMPDMNGFEVVVRLKSDTDTADIPIVIVSTLSAGETGVAMTDLTGWLEKPFDEAALGQAVEQALAAPSRSER